MIIMQLTAATLKKWVMQGIIDVCFELQSAFGILVNVITFHVTHSPHAFYSRGLLLQLDSEKFICDVDFALFEQLAILSRKTRRETWTKALCEHEIPCHPHVFHQQQKSCAVIKYLMHSLALVVVISIHNLVHMSGPYETALSYVTFH